MASGEQRQGLALSGFQPLVELFGDTDRGVVVADLRLVVPEHGEPAVATQAVQTQFDHLAAAPSGDDDGLPGVAEPAVGRVVAGGERLQVRLRGEGLGDFIGEGASCPGDDPSRRGHGGDETPVEAEPFGFAGFQGFQENPPGAGEDHLAGVGRHDGRFPVQAFHSQGRQSVQFAESLVGGEVVHVMRPKEPWVVTAARGPDLQEGAEFGAGSPGAVEGVT